VSRGQAPVHGSRARQEHGAALLYTPSGDLCPCRISDDSARMGAVQLLDRREEAIWDWKQRSKSGCELPFEIGSNRARMEAAIWNGRSRFDRNGCGDFGIRTKGRDSCRRKQLRKSAHVLGMSDHGAAGRAQGSQNPERVRARIGSHQGFRAVASSAKAQGSGMP
jgi:hypothetical protein